jgi:hypothetical protein
VRLGLTELAAAGRATAGRMTRAPAAKLRRPVRAKPKDGGEGVSAGEGMASEFVFGAPERRFDMS